MEETLQKTHELHEAEKQAAAKWEEALTTTQDQVKSLLNQMPETGRLKDLVGMKQKSKHAKKIKQEVEKGA